MRKTLLPMLLAIGTLSADTLILRDGSQVNGTMLSANGRTMSFIDVDGRRRDYSITNVREVHFGDTEFSGMRSRTENTEMASATTVDLVSRLTDNVLNVMERSTLSARQRTMLQDATNVLGRAGHDLRENLSVNNRREVQMALDNVRYVMNSTAVKPADRRIVLQDIAQLRAKYPEFAGSSPRNR
ncbi:MAG TPA: hypothetical protein VER03_18830 [Bryobacteraceae bacterium]|nr:hypothetical protein [Bryobacteraceae bacterium]